MESCGVQAVSNTNLFPAFIKRKNRGQATHFFVKIVLTQKERRSRLMVIAISVERCAAHGLFVEVITFV
jgi:hypothetical protein